MLTFLQNKILVTGFLFLVATTATAQFIRPYSQVFSQNIKGGTAIFGNTSMQIVDNSVANLLKMNETGDAGNTSGGIGFSQYGNDNENMQPVITDIQLPVFNVFSAGATWSYNNPNSDQGIAWRTLVNPTLNWVSATGSFGYGNTETVTIPPAVTNYFLKTVNIATPGLYSTFDFTLTYNDGAVIYVNGVEVQRFNMPAGIINYNTLSLTAVTFYNQQFSIPSSFFTAGNNVIAVEIHQYTPTSTDCLFDMSLNATPLYVSNSSSADLLLPAGTNTIKFARLYWGGRIANAYVTAYPDTLRKIKIRKGTSGMYSNALAPVTSVDQFAINSSTTAYQSYVDITSFIQSNGTGTYTIANIPSNAGAIGGGGNYAGWCIIVAYENSAIPFNSVRIYDGFSNVYFSGTTISQTVTLTGLNVPNNPLVLSDAVMSTMVWEGDANLSSSVANPAGDYVKINGTTASNAVNPVTNFWNGTISKNGAFVHTKTPDFTNQMGIDIDELEVGTGYGILPNATTVDVEFGTEADRYFPSVFGFSIRMKSPVITLNKSVTDANGDGFLQSNEELTYTLSGSNVGPGSAYNTVVIDSLPINVSYVPNSLIIVNAPGITGPLPQTDIAGDDFAFKGINGSRNYVKFFLGAGANSTSGGTMDVNNTYNLKFKVKAGAIPGSVSNTARITSTSQAGDVFTDDGTAIIGPTGGPTPVKLTAFTAVLKNNDGFLNWTTEIELNNDHFEIERSEDGVNFVKRGIVNGNGTTSVTQYYNYTDNINTNSSVIYYRLKNVDTDGKSAYSKIIALRLKGTMNDNFSVYPNPFESIIKINLSLLEDVTVQCRIISFDGKEVMNRKIALLKGDNIVVMKDLEKIASGNYIMEINTGTEKYIKKIVRK
ncbi:MAG: T9SS type A sorting domain-containing protein [Ferruginibacter sp.]|nr:T9SS type A sorting domain-containing protein [Ferruginibacter sp.]